MANLQKKSQMKERLSQLKKRLDGFSERERILVLATGLTMMAAIMYVGVIEPLGINAYKTFKNVGATNKRVELIEQQISAIREAASKDPNEEIKRQIQALNEESRSIESQIESYTIAFVDARQMGNLLGSIMDRYPGLKLQEAKNKPVSEIKIPGIEQPWLFRHSLFLKVEGNYLDILEYVRQVEALPRRIQWDFLKYEVTEYPLGILELEVHTLSTSKEWLGA